MTTMVLKCSECGMQTTERSSYCPECGAEDPWEEVPLFEFDPADLPIVFTVEHYNDSNMLWRAFCDEYWGTPELTGDEIAGLPDDFPEMDTFAFESHWIIDSFGNLGGPFMDEETAKEVADVI